LSQRYPLSRRVQIPVSSPRGLVAALFGLSHCFLRLSPSLLAIILLVGGCEKRTNDVLDSAGAAPFLSQVSLSPSRINSDSIISGPNRQPDDLLEISTLIVARVQANTQTPFSVSYSIRSTDSLVVMSKGELRDDGLAFDAMKGDGLFSGKPTFQIRRVQFGTYEVRVTAESEDGYRSNEVITPLVVFRGNRPPLISDLAAPDTVKLGNLSQTLSLAVRANDPDGLNDVAKVVFSSYRPDGTASGGNPFLMYDDGLPVHGDERAGDGVFSLLVSLPSSTQLGTYRFEFQAFDRSNEPSNVIILKLTVRQ
jgi:hypothetical protein